MAPTAPARPSRISLTFSNVDVRDALVRIAQYAGVDVLLAPGATGTISINLRDRTPDEAIRMVAASAGLLVTQAEGAYVVGNAQEIQRAVSEFGLTEVVRLRYTRAEDAVTFLGKALPTVKAEAMGENLSLTGLLADLRKARELLETLDQPAPVAPEKRETILVALEKADPEQTEAVVKQAFPDLEIKRQDRYLVATGPASLVQALERSIKAIDVAAPTPPEETEVAVVRLRYLHAKRAEDAVKAVFPNIKVTAAGDPNMPPMANFMPLTTGSLGAGGTGTGTGGFGGGVGGFGGAMGGTAYGGAGMGAGGLAGEGTGGVGVSFTRATSLILAGKASDVRAARQVLEEMDVAQPSVRIEASLVEVSEDGLKELGVEWSWKDGNFQFAQTKGLQVNTDSSNLQVSQFTTAIKALVNQGKANLLATPNISCVDNEDASIFIGEMRRFRSTTLISPNVGTVQGTETVAVGIVLLVRPRIHPDGSITLKVHPVVSTVLSVVDGLPQTASREADTTVRLREGEELIIGGLQKTEEIRSADKVPLLGDLPLIGNLFRSTSHRQSRSEVIVILRAYPVFPNPAPPRDFSKGGQP